MARYYPYSEMYYKWTLTQHQQKFRKALIFMKFEGLQSVADLGGAREAPSSQSIFFFFHFHAVSGKNYAK